MAVATLFSNIPYNQNLGGGPPVPALTVVNIGALTTHVDFTLTVSPATGWVEARVNAGPDGVNFPNQQALYCAPNSGGSNVHGLRFHAAPLSGGAGGNDGVQYFTAEVMNVAPGCTASLTMTY